MPRKKAGAVTVNQYPFLSDEWVDESRRIREEYKDQIPEIAVSVRMNQVVNEVPFGDGVIHAHVDTSSGRLEVEPGHLESPDLTVTLSYATAKSILVDGDAQAAMNAFLGGRIKVDGDITKMLALQTVGANSASDPLAVEMVKRIQAMTA
jgi:putative sterol carrier protein